MAKAKSKSKRKNKFTRLVSSINQQQWSDALSLTRELFDAADNCLENIKKYFNTKLSAEKTAFEHMLSTLEVTLRQEPSDQRSAAVEYANYIFIKSIVFKEFDHALQLLDLAHDSISIGDSFPRAASSDSSLPVNKLLAVLNNIPIHGDVVATAAARVLAIGLILATKHARDNEEAFDSSHYIQQITDSSLRQYIQQQVTAQSITAVQQDTNINKIVNVITNANTHSGMRDEATEGVKRAIDMIPSSWNTLDPLQKNTEFQRLFGYDNDGFSVVLSYYVKCGDPKELPRLCELGVNFFGMLEPAKNANLLLEAASYADAMMIASLMTRALAYPGNEALLLAKDRDGNSFMERISSNTRLSSQQKQNFHGHYHKIKTKMHNSANADPGQSGLSNNEEKATDGEGGETIFPDGSAWLRLQEELNAEELSEAISAISEQLTHAQIQALTQQCFPLSGSQFAKNIITCIAKGPETAVGQLFDLGLNVFSLIDNEGGKSIVAEVLKIGHIGNIRAMFSLPLDEAQIQATLLTYDSECGMSAFQAATLNTNHQVISELLPHCNDAMLSMTSRDDGFLAMLVNSSRFSLTSINILLRSHPDKTRELFLFNWLIVDGLSKSSSKSAFIALDQFIQQELKQNADVLKMDLLGSPKCISFLCKPLHANPPAELINAVISAVANTVIAIKTIAANSPADEANALEQLISQSTLQSSQHKAAIFDKVDQHFSALRAVQEQPVREEAAKARAAEREADAVRRVEKQQLHERARMQAVAALAASSEVAESESRPRRTSVPLSLRPSVVEMLGHAAHRKVERDEAGVLGIALGLQDGIVHESFGDEPVAAAATRSEGVQPPVAPAAGAGVAARPSKVSASSGSSASNRPTTQPQRSAQPDATEGQLMLNPNEFPALPELRMGEVRVVQRPGRRERAETAAKARRKAAGDRAVAPAQTRAEATAEPQEANVASTQEQPCEQRITDLEKSKRNLDRATQAFATALDQALPHSRELQDKMALGVLLQKASGIVLLEMIKQNLVGEVEILLRTKPDLLSYNDPHGGSILHFAVRFNAVNAVTFLVDNYEQLLQERATDQYQAGMTALHIAASGMLPSSDGMRRTINWAIFFALLPPQQVYSLLNMTDSYGRTAADIARAYCGVDIAPPLVQGGIVSPESVWVNRMTGVSFFHPPAPPGLPAPEQGCGNQRQPASS